MSTVAAVTLAVTAVMWAVTASEWAAIASVRYDTSRTRNRNSAGYKNEKLLGAIRRTLGESGKLF